METQIHDKTHREAESPYMLRKGLKAVKAAVSLEEYLSNRGVELVHGRSCCPIHQGDNPQALSVNSERQRWHCFRCNEGGDLIDLHQALEGGELWEVVVDLADCYNVDLPQRPEPWHRRQGEKAQDRKRILVAVKNSYQRRFYRVYAPIVLDLIEDPDERREESGRIWRDLETPAWYAARRRVEGGVHA